MARRFNPTSEQNKRKHLKNTYGLTLEQYNELGEQQNWKCAICKRDSKRLCVDHDHATGKVRALLCVRCNWVLGHVEDSPRLLAVMIVYLEDHGKLFEI